jgi:tRNA dimethylallyltransferase
LVLTGATGSGKSELAISLAKDLDGEIINADAFQVYQEFTIATAAPTEEMKKRCRIISMLSCRLRRLRYCPLSKGLPLGDRRGSRGKTPILVGGSGLYIRSALYDYDLSLDTSKVDMSPYEKL